MRICSNCGAEFKEKDGESYNIGKKTIWNCPECSKVGARQADARSVKRTELIRDKKFRKE
jgi:DNA-directed RNA polymerase subunit RPC12/RpoP